MNEDDRPDPDSLLRSIRSEAEKTTRGKLKIFFGMCPGVGKTFAMLRAAQEKHAAGVKVVIGFIETHRRSETEKLTLGLELIPRRQIDYKGTVVEEFDIDRALQRKPELILVDELAHSNAPGSKHPKRYQDIKDLLYAGVDVYTTMNVQHVESRADLVYQIAGVPVRETVPDAFLELADQIELIDLSAEDLIRRLKDGKVYLGERADRAATHFFQAEKLNALRELALRFTAELVDDQLRSQMQNKRISGPWNTNERLMVAISPSPSSARLIRSTRRIASRLEAPWVALYVDTGTELNAKDHETLTKNLSLARELGAEVVTTRERNIPKALRRVAQETNVTQIVMGRPERRFFRDFFGLGNILSELVFETSEIDIHLIRQKKKPVYRDFWPKLQKVDLDSGILLKTLLYTIAISSVAYAFREVVGYRAIGFVFLLGLLPISIFAGLIPTLLGAFLTSIIWNYFFIPPQFTFNINEAEDFMMILVYFSVASVTGFLTTRIRRQEHDLIQRERRANILYNFGKHLSEATTDLEMIQSTTASIESIIACTVVILRSDIEGSLSRTSLDPLAQPISEKDFAVATWAYLNQKKAGWKTDTLSSADCLCLPLRGRSGMMGVLMAYPRTQRSLTIEQENLLKTICDYFATALEREALKGLSRKAEIYEKSEKLHQALLDTVSHELRTPLTTIVGCLSALKETGIDQPPTVRDHWVRDAAQSADRLSHTIENLMDMSRISSGVLKINEQIFDLNDFIQSTAFRRVIDETKDLIRLDLCEENLFIKGDERLLDHLLQNLIANAIQHSRPGQSITIRTRRNQFYAECSVLDQGTGIDAHDIDRVFDRFFQASGSGTGGVGLGLAIVKAIAEAHGGSVFAANRTECPGAVFSFLLPLYRVPEEVLR